MQTSDTFPNIGFEHLGPDIDDATARLRAWQLSNFMRTEVHRHSIRRQLAQNARPRRRLRTPATSITSPLDIQNPEDYSGKLLQL